MKKKLIILSLLAVIVFCSAQFKGVLVSSFNVGIDIPTDYVAYYPFNGNADDESGNGNDLTVTGATLTTDYYGNTDRAYNFTGSSSQFLSLDANILDFTDDVTITFDIYVTDFTSVSRPLTLSNGASSFYYLGVTILSGAYGHLRNDGSARATDKFNSSTGAWYRFALTKNNTDFEFFVDNTSVGTSTHNNTFLTQSYLRIGCGYFTSVNSAYFTGKISNIRIYQRELSATELEYIYNE